MIDSDLCVIGCGPTGISALVEARRRGIRAIGLEASFNMLPSFHRHTDGLVYRSPANHFEVANLPLDCVDPTTCTREDVLDYYARVIALAELDVRCGWRCVRIDPVPTGLLLWAITREGPCKVRVRHVIVTNWYRRRPLELAQVGVFARVPIFDDVRSPSAFAGMRVAIVGAGSSGIEAATALMLNGVQVQIVTRRSSSEIGTSPGFARLIAASGSEIVDFATSYHIDEDVLVAQASGQRRLQCDAVVNATGKAVDARTIRMLRRAGLLERNTARRIVNAHSLQQLARTASPEKRGLLLNHIGRELPDLWDDLFVGKRGVRFAGGVLHFGSAAAGTVISIASAKLAVRAIDGAPPPLSRRRLCWALSDVERLATSLRDDEDSAPLDLIRPLRLGPFGRSAKYLVSGLADAETFDDDDSLSDNAPPTGSCVDAALLRLANGEHSVQDIKRILRLQRTADRLGLDARVRWLCQHNQLTWLPSRRPSHTSVPGQQSVGAL